MMWEILEGLIIVFMNVDAISWDTNALFLSVYIDW